MQALTNVQLLGCFKLYARGREVSVPLQAQRLVAFLAIRGAPMDRHRLAEQLWPFTSEQRAYANLRTAIWRVRREAPGTVSARHDSVELGDDVGVDYRELLEDQQLGRAPVAEGILVGVLRAELLPGWDEDWLLIERERARQLRMRRLEQLSGELLVAGRTAEAIDAAFTSIEIEPLRESAHLALIEAHVVDGNCAEAANHAERVRILIREELGIAPSVHFRNRVTELGLATAR